MTSKRAENACRRERPAELLVPPGNAPGFRILPGFHRYAECWRRNYVTSRACLERVKKSTSRVVEGIFVSPNLAAPL